MPPNKLTAALSIALLLVGCNLPAARPHKVSPVQAAPPAAPATLAPGPGTAPQRAVYRIDPARSELRLLVFRAGPMALLGHDHVIVNRALAGWVHLGGGSSAASFRLEIPAAAFAVDEPQARSAEGPEFAEQISEDARQGTRRNMLGDALLDAQNHPLIIVQSVGIEGSEPGLAAIVSITAGGHESKQRIAFMVARSATELDATADFQLRQSLLGLTPFSVMMGALQVQDEFRVKLELVAAPASSEVDPRGVEPGGAGQRRDDDRGPLGSEQ